MHTLAAMVVLTASTATAQAPKLEPPRVEHVTDPRYPPRGEGQSVVVLILVIDVDGSVRSAEVASGAEPFASAAREATRGWLFTPATRAGEPVAAKVRYRVKFTPDKTPEAGALEAPPQLSTDDVLEVVVEGEKLPPSVSSLKRAEVRRLPGAFGDPFRAIEILPGVTPIVSGLPFFYVRGAPPGNIGYFLDGVRVPYLFHAAAGPSVVHPAIVDRVDLHAGGYPAQYGRFSGGIVSAETNEPDPTWKGEGSIRLVDAGVLVEGGFADGKGTALLGGRYSYTAAILTAITPDITLDYRDYQARVSYDITSRDRVSLFAFGAYDLLSNTRTLDETGDEVETVLFGAEFYRVDGRYDARLPGGGKLRAAVTCGYDQSRLFGTRNSQSMLIGSRVNITRPLTDTVTLRGGINVQVDSYTADGLTFADPDNPFTQDFNNLFPARSDTGAAGWADVVWKPNKLFEITPGIRVDTYYSDGAKAIAFDPRLAVVAHVSDDVRVLHALGIANQPPAFIVPVPGLAVANLGGGLQRSIQAASGVEVDLPLKITATVTGYAGTFLNMTDAIGADQDPQNDEIIPRSLGSSKGIEVYVRRALTERLGGFVSYTFSRTTRSVGRDRFLALFDRPHVLHTAFGYDFGRGWHTGLRFSVYSGTPNAETSEGAPPRDPVFYRLDFRVEKKWKILNDTGWISFVIEMVNATLNRETLGGTRIPPVSIPSLGVEGGF